MDDLTKYWDETMKLINWISNNPITDATLDQEMKEYWEGLEKK